MKQLILALAAFLSLSIGAQAQTGVLNPDGSVTYTVPFGLDVPQYRGRLDRVEFETAPGSVVEFHQRVPFAAGTYVYRGDALSVTSVRPPLGDALTVASVGMVVPMNGDAPGGGEVRAFNGVVAVFGSSRTYGGVYARQFQGRGDIDLFWETHNSFSATMLEGSLAGPPLRYEDPRGVAVAITYYPATP